MNLLTVAESSKEEFYFINSAFWVVTVFSVKNVKWNKIWELITFLWNYLLTKFYLIIGWKIEHEKKFSLTDMLPLFLKKNIYMYNRMHDF